MSIFNPILDGIETIGRATRDEIRKNFHDKILNLVLQTLLLIGATIASFYFAPLAAIKLNSYALKIILNIAGIISGIETILTIKDTIQVIFNYFQLENDMYVIHREWNDLRYGR